MPAYGEIIQRRSVRVAPLAGSLCVALALRLPSVLSIPYGLDQLEPGLAKALN